MVSCKYVYDIVFSLKLIVFRDHPFMERKLAAHGNRLSGL